MNHEVFIPSKLTTQKIAHGSLILHGVTEKCAHCGLDLTDALSIQTSLGPKCRKTAGYFTEPDFEGDVMDAMVHLSPYPEVFQFMLDHYKPGGARALMNGLVRLCALNRKTQLHRDCTNAIEVLGYRKLASTLRRSIEDVVVKTSKDFPGFLQVWIRRALYNSSFNYDCRQDIPNHTWNRRLRSRLVPDSDKRALWTLLRKHYAGCLLTTAEGTREIPVPGSPPSTPPGT